MLPAPEPLSLEDWVLELEKFSRVYLEAFAADSGPVSRYAAWLALQGAGPRLSDSVARFESRWPTVLAAGLLRAGLIRVVGRFQRCTLFS